MIIHDRKVYLKRVKGLISMLYSFSHRFRGELGNCLCCVIWFDTGQGDSSFTLKWPQKPAC